MESESDPLTRRPVDLFEKEPVKGNSKVHLHTPTKFGEDWSKDLGGDREKTDKQTDRQTNAARFIVWLPVVFDQTITITITLEFWEAYYYYYYFHSTNVLLLLLLLLLLLFNNPAKC